MQKHYKKNSTRNHRGISIILLTLVLAMLLLTIDFFSFNIARVLMIQRQVSGICEAAALAGTSILARTDISADDAKHSKLSKAQKSAYRCAQNMLLKNHILNHNLNNAIEVPDLSDLGKNLQIDTCQYTIKLADPDSNYSPVDFGDPSGKTISCSIVYGYRPMMLSFLRDFCYNVVGNSVGGLPQIDSVIALDLSCSMDDQTIVTFVRREWIHNQLGAGNFAAGKVDPDNMNSRGCGIIQYVSLNCPSLPHTLANYLGWDYNIGVGTDGGNSEVLDGSLVNVLAPQNLDKAANEPHGAITHPMYFNAYLRSHYSHYDSKTRYQPWEAAQAPYNRARDYGTPPGNCDLSVGLGGNGDGDTDMAGNAVTFYRGASAAMPQINAFSDLTWQYDKDRYFGYQPAAPGATQGLGQNDPIPSPDEQTFTDLVVNITPPHEQPMLGADTFVGFVYRFPVDDPDPLLRNQFFSFPNIAVVVEAARGNLEHSTNLQTGLTNAQLALIDRPVSIDGNIFDMGSIELKDGYQRAYQRLAMLCSQPLGSIITAVDQQYLEKLYKLTDSRFALVSFSSKGALKGVSSGAHFKTFGTDNDVSVDPTSLLSYYIFAPPYGDSSYANACYDSGIPTAYGLNNTEIFDGYGEGFRMPRVPLSANDGHYLECASKNKVKTGELNNHLNYGAGANGIYNCRVQTVCDTSEALETSRQMFSSNDYDLLSSAKNRIPARRLIIFICDGEPTGGINSSEAQETLRIAGSGENNKSMDTCESQGIAVFTIGINLAKGLAYYKLKEHQASFLGNKAVVGNTYGGLAKRARHGGKYYECENLSQLKPIFADISRKFVQCQR